jgi:AbrB family transcriptional regulator (stage V sporulation protein T)
MEERRAWSSFTTDRKMPVPGFEEANQIMVPIIHEGDVVGSVLLLSKDKAMGELEMTLCQTAADFLAKQLG